MSRDVRSRAAGGAGAVRGVRCASDQRPARGKRGGAGEQPCLYAVTGSPRAAGHAGSQGLRAAGAQGLCQCQRCWGDVRLTGAVLEQGQASNSGCVSFRPCPLLPQNAPVPLTCYRLSPLLPLLSLDALTLQESLRNQSFHDHASSSLSSCLALPHYRKATPAQTGHSLHWKPRRLLHRKLCAHHHPSG